MADPTQIETFMDITGTTNEVAEQILQAANYDLELAINLHMEGTPPQNASPPNPPSTASAGSSIDYQDLTGDEDDVRAPIAPRMDLMITSDEDNFTVGRKRHAPKSVFVPLRDFSEETRLQEEELMAVAGGSDTARQYRNKRRRLEDLFRPPIDICYVGSFQNARDAATSHNMWLLVNVQDHTEFACQVLNRDVWSNKEVKDIIRKHFVFWQVSVDSADGARFKTFYGVYSYPYVCVIDPRTGENKTHWRGAGSVTSGSGSVSAGSGVVDAGFAKELERFLLLTPNPLISPTYRAPLETVVNLTEEDQIALAIKNSLLQHQQQRGESAGGRDVIVNGDDDDDVDDKYYGGGGARDASCSNSNSNSSSGCSMAATAATSAAARPNDETRSSQLGKRPSYEDYLGSETDEKTRISVRLPDGAKEMLVWPCTSRIKALELYIDARHPELRRRRRRGGRHPAPAASSSSSYKIITAFPRQDITAMASADDAVTLRDAGLHPASMVHVHVDDDDVISDGDDDDDGEE